MKKTSRIAALLIIFALNAFADGEPQSLAKGGGSSAGGNEYALRCVESIWVPNAEKVDLSYCELTREVEICVLNVDAENKNKEVMPNFAPCFDLVDF